MCSSYTVESPMSQYFEKNLEILNGHHPKNHQNPISNLLVENFLPLSCRSSDEKSVPYFCSGDVKIDESLNAFLRLKDTFPCSSFPCDWFKELFKLVSFKCECQQRRRWREALLKDEFIETEEQKDSIFHRLGNFANLYILNLKGHVIGAERRLSGGMMIPWMDLTVELGLIAYLIYFSCFFLFHVYVLLLKLQT